MILGFIANLTSLFPFDVSDPKKSKMWLVQPVEEFKVSPQGLGRCSSVLFLKAPHTRNRAASLHKVLLWSLSPGLLGHWSWAYPS